MAERFAILCVAPDWVSPPRTAHDLMRHDAEICIIAPPNTYAALTRFKAADVLLPFSEINRKLPAIIHTMAEDFGAYAVLAGDNAAFTLLAQLVGRLDTLNLSSATRSLLERSMPNARIAATVAVDSAFIASSAVGPCAPPNTLANPTLVDALAFARQHGWPLVVKRDGYAAGKGVSICAGEQALQEAFTSATGGLVVQRYVHGVVYGVAVSGVRGRAAGAFSFRKYQVWPEPSGAATVLKYEQRPEIIADARQRFETLGLCGFAGFDYIIDGSGRAHLLEVNPYIVENYLGLCFGHDLTAALLAAIRGEPAPSPGTVTHEFVAIFPGEWRRDGASPYLQSAYHDVPWDDPQLMAAMVRDCVTPQPGASANVRG